MKTTNTFTPEKTPAQKWEEATLATNFIFCKIMESEPELCKHLLEILLHIEIDHLEPPQAERTFKESIDSKSVRFDVYTKDSSRIFDLEIQTINKKNLPKRARYYQSLLDMSNLNEGVNYKKLKDSYIIFICLHDMFGKKQPVYTFENICLENPEVKLNDGTHKVFFNAKNSDIIESEDEKLFFEFLKSGIANDDFTNTLKAKVSLAKKNMEWRNQYMTWQQMIDDEKDDAREEGLAEGREQGLAEGRERGLAEGREQGRTEGSHKAKIETARILKHSGVDLSLIQKATGLTSDQINEL